MKYHWKYYFSLDYLNELYLRFKWFKQRGSRGWADTDTWHTGYYVADISIGMLNHLITHGSGYPSSLTNKEWKNILRQIRDGFKAVKEIDNYYGIDGVAKEKKLKILKEQERVGLKLFAKYIHNLWD